MKLQIISDFPLIDNYIDVLKSVVSELDTNHIISEAEHVELLDDLCSGDPIMLLGPRPSWLSSATPVIMAPSVRATLGTAGGVTKLRWAVSRALSGRTAWTPGSDLYAWQRASASVSLPVATLVAVDIEVSGDIRVDEPEDTEMLSLAVCWKDYEAETYHGVVWDKEQLSASDVKRVLADVLADNLILTHNGKFDMRWVNRYLEGYVVEPLYPDQDTMLMHHAMYPGAAEHGLKPLAHRILGASDWEADIKKHTGGSVAHYERIPQDILTEYNAFDVFWTYKLYERFVDMMDDDARRLYEEHTLPASHMLQDVEDWGMAVDLEYAKELDAWLLDNIDALRAKLEGKVKNPNSTQQVKAYIKEHYNINMSSVDKNNLNASVMLIERCDGADSPRAAEYREFVDSILGLRTEIKARSTYVTSIVNKVRNGRVHPTFLVHGTSTGRLSSSGPNVQNVSNDVEGRMSLRHMYMAAEGNLLVGADYSQAELRTMAELSDDELMIADLQEDSPDFFDNMLPSTFPDTDFTELDKTHRKPFRLKLKRVVYGSSYGLTPPSIAAMLTLEGAPTTLQEAQDIQDRYLNRYPGLNEWRINTMPLVVSGDELITPFGRRFHQDVVSDANFLRVQNQAWAFRPQSIASDICLRAAMMVHRHFTEESKYAGCHIIASVHDAIYCEVPESLADDVMHLVQRCMRESGAMTFHRIPFLTDAHCGKYWNEV